MQKIVDLSKQEQVRREEVAKQQIMLDVHDECVVVSLLNDGDTELSIGFPPDKGAATVTGCAVVEKALEIVFGEEKAKDVLEKLREKIRLKTMEN